MTGHHKLTCPACGSPNDGQTNPKEEESVPSDGDLSICLYCGHPAVFVADGDGLAYRELTDEEREEFERNEEVQWLLAVREMVMKRDR